MAPEQRTDVVLADSNLSLFQDLTGRSLSLNDYLNRRYWGAAGHTGLAPERVRDLEVLMSRRYTSISDADFVRQLLSLERARNIRLSLYMARDYGMQDLQTNNVILVGSRRSNPWVELFEDRLNFLFEVDPANLLPRYRNRRPQPNEQAFYSVGQKEDGDAYGDIAFLPNLGRSGNALLISGTGIQAIRAGAECITSDDRFAAVHKLLMQHPAKDGLPFFEVLFRTKRVGGSSTGFEVVASRIGNYVR